MKIINMKYYSQGMEKAARYYHEKWGNERNFAFYYDAISHSSATDSGLPRFYLLLKDDRIIGCCGLVVNDFISRHDLMPWLAGIYVEESERGNGLGNFLMNHAEYEARKLGYPNIYLTTDHDGYYEKYGWTRIEDGYELSGNPTKIYMKTLS